MSRLYCAMFGLLLVACNADRDGDGLTNGEERELGTDANAVDTDSDGISDFDEVEAGTDPLSDDSDGDGLTDGEERDCVSDPLDADETCYACGWPHADPGDLVSEGASEGDVVENIELIDQCGDAVALWDLAGEYHILFMTAEW